MKFNEFGLEQDIVEAVEAMGFDTATPIQEAAIPVILEGKDLIASAQTGTGKTGAFLVPILNALHTSDAEEIKALVVVPTRELAQQIDQQVQGLSYFANVSSLAIYGGNDSMGWDKQKAAITQGVDILIATPGRILAHMTLGYVDLKNLDFLVLDEADRMLDMGFHADIMKINEAAREGCQKLLFSATMPPKIRELAKKIQNAPEEISLAISKPAERILQAAYMVYDKQKIPLVLHLLNGKEDLKSIIIFISAKKKASELEKELIHVGVNAKAIHSDLDQPERESVLLDFRNRKIQTLVATDIMARGIDIDEIDLVINFDVPRDPEDYIHRIGRTARASASGVGLTFITESDQHSFARIERLIGNEIHKPPVPEELGEAPSYDPKARKGRYRSSGKGGGKGRPKNNQGGRKPKGKSGGKPSNRRGKPTQGKDAKTT